MRAAMTTIGEFQDDYRWLSNFWLVPIVVDGVAFPSVEHAYQAAKFDDNPWAKKMFADRNMRPGEAKTLAKKFKPTPDWPQKKLAVMERLLRIKFSNQELAQMLIDTGEAILVEGNNWRDTFWGVYKGVGANHLGELLMKIRKELKANPPKMPTPVEVLDKPF